MHYEVKYREDGVEKSERFESFKRDEAFLFQSGLLARRTKGADGKWNIEPVGVYEVE